MTFYVFCFALYTFFSIVVAREGQRGAIAPPKMPKKYIFTQKQLRQISIFLPRSLQKKTYSDHSWVRSAPPPKKSTSSKTNSWLRLWFSRIMLWSETVVL